MAGARAIFFIFLILPFLKGETEGFVFIFSSLQ